MSTDKTWTYHGEGIKSKLRKKDGKRIYYVQVWYNGRRCTEKAGTTLKVAMKKLGSLDTEIQAGTYLPPSERKLAVKLLAVAQAEEQAARPTFKQFAETYLTKKRHGWKRPRWHEDMIASLVRVFPNCLLDEMTLDSIEAALTPLHASPGKHNRHLRYLRTMLRFAVERKLLPFNPSAGVTFAQTEEPAEKEPLTHGEAQELIEEIEPGLRPALKVALATGMRWCEISDLRWKDVKLGERVLYVRRSVKNKESIRKHKKN